MELTLEKRYPSIAYRWIKRLKSYLYSFQEMMYMLQGMRGGERMATSNSRRSLKVFRSVLYFLSKEIIYFLIKIPRVNHSETKKLLVIK